MGILTDHLLVISCSATTTYLCWLHHSLLPDKESYFVCLLAVAFYLLQCVRSLSIPQGIHLVIVTHPCFFWVACHPSRTFPPKEPEQEPQNRFFSLPTARPCLLLPLTHDSPLSILAGYRLVVPRFCACFTFFARNSCICCDLEIGLYVLPCTFGFLWRELFCNLPFFTTCFF